MLFENISKPTNKRCDNEMRQQITLRYDFIIAGLICSNEY